MESGKQGSSDASSTEETDRVDQVKGGGDTAATTTKRSYECTFCKRGFTNAQALGGHMNIHRKDRAKAKHPTMTTTSFSARSDQSTMIDHDYMINPSYSNLPPMIMPTEATKFYPISEAQRNYHMYFQPPLSYSSPRFPYGYYDHDHHEFTIPARSQSLSMNEEHLGANLSLRIGPTHVVDEDMMKEDEEVDLELRLGHHP